MKELFTLCLVALVWTGGWVYAQSAEADDIAVTFGFAGQIVANTWNPLRVSLRDVPAAELIVEIDAGTLRQGSKRYTYRAALTGGRGLSIFEDDVYVPAWQSFSWLVRTPERVLKSGSVARRLVDKTPLELLLAPEVGAGSGLYPESARVVDLAPDALTERAASYSGVRSVLLLPRGSPPASAALAAASTAGSTVLLSPELGSAFDRVLALAPAAQQTLGTGRLVRLPEQTLGAVTRTLSDTPTLRLTTLLEALISDELTATPGRLGTGWLTLALSVYALFTALLLRYGGAPGGVAALLLAALLAGGAAQLRPDDPLLIRTRTLHVGHGGLALNASLKALYSHTRQRASLPQATHPLSLEALSAWDVNQTGTTLTLEAGETALLMSKPSLERAAFYWQDEALVNDTGGTLTDVFVQREGAQPGLAEGERRRPTEGPASPPDLFARLLEHLPEGSALARRGGNVYVALPYASLAGVTP